MTETRTLRAYAEVALGRQRSPQHDQGPHMVKYLRAANVDDGALALDDVKEMNFDPKEQVLFALQRGDVLVTEGSGSRSTVGASAVWNAQIGGMVCFQNTLLRLRPRSLTDSKYLAWWCRHAHGDGLFASIASGANILHLSADRVRSLPMNYVPLGRQSAIADYLDTETARVDALITKKQSLRAVLLAKVAAEIEASIWSNKEREVAPLTRFVQEARPIMYGIVLPGPDVEVGVSIVKGGDVKNGLEDTRQLCKTTLDIESRYERSRLREGDLVFAIRGGVGDVVMVGPAAAGANMTQDVARVAPKPGIDGRWLLYALRSPRVQAEAEVRTTGATIRGLNVEDLKRLPLPVVREDEQRQQAAEIDRIESRGESAQRLLAHQIELLKEHRQALITAAVTGELGIGEAA